MTQAEAQAQDNPTLELIINDIYFTLAGVTGFEVEDLSHTDDLDDLAQDADLEEDEDEAYDELLDRVFANAEFATLPRVPDYEEVPTVADLIKAVAAHLGVLPTTPETFVHALDAAEAEFQDTAQDDDEEGAGEEDEEDVRLNFMHEASIVVQIMAVRRLSVINERHGDKMRLHLTSPDLKNPSDVIEYDWAADGLTGYFDALKQALESFGANNEIENIFEDTLFPDTEVYGVDTDDYAEGDDRLALDRDEDSEE